MEARLLGQIKPFIVMEVLERANELQKQGVDIIHMEVGEPDFDVPECVKAACEAGIRSGYTHYTHSLGDPELREAISRHYKNTYGVFGKTGTNSGYIRYFSRNSFGFVCVAECRRRGNSFRSGICLLR